MTKAEFKKAIAALSKAELEKLLLDTFSANKEARTALTHAFGVDPAELELMLDDTRERIWKAFHPARGYYAKSCVVRSNKAINEFKQVCKEPEMIADLLVFQVEQIAECNLEWDFYARSFDNRTMACAKFLARHNLLARFEQRMDKALAQIAKFSFVSCERTLESYLESISNR